MQNDAIYQFEQAQAEFASLITSKPSGLCLEASAGSSLDDGGRDSYNEIYDRVENFLDAFEVYIILPSPPTSPKTPTHEKLRACLNRGIKKIQNPQAMNAYLACITRVGASVL